MKSLRNKVILSGIVLVFAFIATIGSTFAWFTVSQTVAVQEMQLNVTASDNLLIRVKDGTEASEAFLLNPSNYQTTITLDDLYAAGYLYETISGGPGTWNLTDAWRLQPSTIIEDGYASVNAKTLSVLSDLSDPDRGLSAAVGNDNEGQYIRLEFYLISQSDVAQTVELDTISILSSVSNSTEQAAVANAARLSVWLDENFTVGADTLTGTAGSAFVFGNDIDYDFAFLLNNSGFSTTNANISLIAAGGTFNQLTDLDTNPVGTPSNHFEISAYNAAGNPTDVFTIAPNTPTLVTVLIYIEGWDAQADNDIVEAAFRIAFGFKFGTQD